MLRLLLIIGILGALIIAFACGPDFSNYKLQCQLSSVSIDHLDCFVVPRDAKFCEEVDQQCFYKDISEEVNQK